MDECRRGPGFAPDPRLTSAGERLGGVRHQPAGASASARAGCRAGAGRISGRFSPAQRPAQPGLQSARTLCLRMGAANPPVIVHLMADRPEETARAWRSGSNRSKTSWRWSWALPPLLADDLVLMSIEMAAGELPLIVNLTWEQVPCRLALSALALKQSAWPCRVEHFPQAGAWSPGVCLPGALSGKPCG